MPVSYGESAQGAHFGFNLTPEQQKTADTIHPKVDFTSFTNKVIADFKVIAEIKGDRDFSEKLRAIYSDLDDELSKITASLNILENSKLDRSSKFYRIEHAALTYEKAYIEYLKSAEFQPTDKKMSRLHTDPAHIIPYERFKAMVNSYFVIEPLHKP